MDRLLRHAILFVEMVFELQMRNAITSLTMLDVTQVANQLTHNGHVLEMLGLFQSVPHDVEME